jgi:N-succinyldiaminopimelate aminotransferase
MNKNIQKLQPYPFEKLAKLKSGITPCGKQHIALSIGEPKHKPPQFVLDNLKSNMHEIAKYPTTKGTDELRQTIATWLEKRFHIKSVNAHNQVLPVNGTREALFAFTQATVDASNGDALVLSPNPFYQIYEGAAYLAGAEPYFLNCLTENNFIPDYSAISEDIWERCQILFICTPSNPTGSVTSLEQFKELIELAQKYNFIIASDECYSELYPDENNPPVGLLEACAKFGNEEFKNCVVFHSLSKRSNLPGLRSGFIAGDANLLAPFLSYRTYHGSAMPIPNQLASIAAWSDEEHVKQNRHYYRQKFSDVYELLKDNYEIKLPQAGFYYWLKTPIADTDFAAKLFEQQNITVLPGRFLSREINGINPGEGYVRMAMVAEVDECLEAGKRLLEFSLSLN